MLLTIIQAAFCFWLSNNTMNAMGEILAGIISVNKAQDFLRNLQKMSIHLLSIGNISCNQQVTN